MLRISIIHVHGKIFPHGAQFRVWLLFSFLLSIIISTFFGHPVYKTSSSISLTSGFFCAKTAAMVVPEIGEEMRSQVKGFVFYLSVYISCSLYIIYRIVLKRSYNIFTLSDSFRWGLVNIFWGLVFLGDTNNGWEEGREVRGKEESTVGWMKMDFSRMKMDFSRMSAGCQLDEDGFQSDEGGFQLEEDGFQLDEDGF